MISTRDMNVPATGNGEAPPVPSDAACNSLGIAKAPADTRVVVAMSGGVDSSVTAAVLVEQGYEVIGITLQLYDYGAARPRPGACCAGEDVYDARQVAERLSIPHYVLDYQSRFRAEVIDDFADAYLRGETPIPCIRCNQTVKFRDLLATARDLGAEVLATGHYVRREIGPAGPELHRAADPARDQSYFLFTTTKAQLDPLRFPLGAMASKSATRELAERFGLAVAEKPDSQDICFVPDGDYAAVIDKLRPDAVLPGDIVDLGGAVLGRHDGISRYTVGQRRGLGVGGGDALYVVRLEPESRRVVVGPRAALARTRVALYGVNWLGEGDLPKAGFACAVKLRSAQEPVAAVLHGGPEGTAEVVLEEPEHGVAPGQACVFYDGERVMGGGWIRGAD